MRDCLICVPMDCLDTDAADAYSLESAVFPFVLNCPPGSPCNPRAITLLVCCDEDVPIVIPPNSSDEQVEAIFQAAVDECARKTIFCDPENAPVVGQPFRIFLNAATSATVNCPDGNPFTYTLQAGSVAGFSQTAVNRTAARRAKALAREHRVCISNLRRAICVDVAYSQSLRASGTYVARFPAQDFWSITSGTVPTGLTFTGGFQTNGASLAGTKCRAAVLTSRSKLTMQV